MIAIITRRHLSCVSISAIYKFLSFLTQSVKSYQLIRLIVLNRGKIHFNSEKINNIFKLLMSDSIKPGVGCQEPMRHQDRDLQELNQLEKDNNLQLPDNFHKRYTSHYATLDPSQLKKVQQENPGAIDAGGSPEHPTPGVGVQSTRRAFTVVDHDRGDEESFVFKEPELEMEF